MKNDKKVGLFPLIVYLPVELNQVLLDKIYNEIPSDFKPIDENDVPLHISLSKNEVLPHHCIEGFSDALVKGLREAEIAKFRVTMKRFNRYKNENGDKDFIAIDIDKGSKKILGIVDIVNNVMKRYGLNLYYDNPEFHVSIACQSTSAFTDEFLDQVVTNLDSKFSKHLSRLKPKIHCCEFRIGSKIFKYDFQEK